VELLLSMTMPNLTLQWPHMRSCISCSGKIFHIPLQSRLVTLWLSCVQANVKGMQRSALRDRYRYSRSDHLAASPTATGLLQTWYKQTRETVGYLSKQPWGICQITWTLCCAVHTVRLFIKQPLYIQTQSTFGHTLYVDTVYIMNTVYLCTQSM
jgi:hypothetical protein